MSAAEAKQRKEKYGPNQLAGKKKEPDWQAFLRQSKDFMQILLLGAAIVNQIIFHETSTTLVLILLTEFYAVLGMNQESKAEASLMVGSNFSSPVMVMSHTPLLQKESTAAT